MTKKTRDWLFGIFVFLFVVITIILSLYATGYRFNLSWPLRFDRLLLKTGTLALDTTPHGATILITSETKISSVFSLSNTKKNQITPIKIKNLLPGDYVVSFNLDNYWPYEKKLHVNPEQTTFLEDVILFKKSLPLNVFSAKPQDISYSPNGAYAWLKNDGDIINLKTEQTIAKVNTKKITWISNGKQISDGSKLINLENGSISNYNIGNVNDLQTSSGNNLVIYLAGNNLAALDTTNNSTTIIPTDGTVLNYSVSGDILYMIITNKNKTKLEGFNLKNKTALNSLELLNSKSFNLNQDNTKNIILSDNEHKIVYILSVGSDNRISTDVVRNATVFKWLDGNRLAYVSDSEIYIYDLTQTRSYFITRLSEKINSLTWSVDNYLIYSTEKEIGTINLTNQGNDITILWRGSNLSSLYFDNKNGVLYFSGAIGQQNGLYKMALK